MPEATVLTEEIAFVKTTAYAFASVPSSAA